MLSPQLLKNLRGGKPVFRHVADAEHEANKRKIGERGPQKTPTKERITIRLSHDVVSRFRASGTG